jgi:hypothetical protein
LLADGGGVVELIVHQPWRTDDEKAGEAFFTFVEQMIECVQGGAL